jgi:hypothetical protein
VPKQLFALGADHYEAGVLMILKRCCLFTLDFQARKKAGIPPFLFTWF